MKAENWSAMGATLIPSTSCIDSPVTPPPAAVECPKTNSCSKPDEQPDSVRANATGLRTTSGGKAFASHTVPAWMVMLVLCMAPGARPIACFVCRMEC